MSEAELHILKARMLAGRDAKARRGELNKPLPMGYLRRPSGEVAFDPDEQAKSVIRLAFDLFQRLRTVSGVLRYLVENGIKMPVRARGGAAKGELEWRRPSRPSLGDLFSNPISAGVYVYGVRPIDRRRRKPGRPGAGRQPPRPREAEVFLPDRMPAYIAWDQFERNQEQIRSNRTNELGPARAGSAPLSGPIVCGRCGLRMIASYNNAGHTARYACVSMHTSYDEPFCQTLKAEPVDTPIARLILKALEPAAIEASLAAAADLESERAAVDRHWRQRLERAQYQVDQARRRYASVEPENRLAARTLEQDWETALSEQARLAAEYERFTRERPKAPTPAEWAAIQDLTNDLPALWRAETTDPARAPDDRPALAGAGHRLRGRRKRTSPPGMPLARREPNHASTRAAGRKAEGSQRLSEPRRSVGRPASRRSELRRDRSDPQPGRLAAAQAARHLQRPHGSARLGQRRTDRGKAQGAEGDPPTTPRRVDDRRTGRADRRASIDH
jgi:Recombinase/Recombinase zinc beta ribbon domain